MARSQDTHCGALRRFLREGRNWGLIGTATMGVAFAGLTVTLLVLAGKVMRKLDGNALATWVLTLAILSVFEVAMNAGAWLMVAKGWKRWRYAVVVCGVVYCLSFSLTVFVLHEIDSTLGGISDDITSSCTTAPSLGSLRLAYDLAYQLSKPYQSSLSALPLCQSVPCLPSFSIETSLLLELESTQNCGGVCAIGPKVFSEWKMAGKSCKGALGDMVGRGRRIALGVIAAALVVKTIGLLTAYWLVLTKGNNRAYGFPQIDLPTLEVIMGRGNMHTPALPADVSFAKPLSPPKLAAPPQLRSPVKSPSVLSLSPSSLQISPIPLKKSPNAPPEKSDLSLSSSENSLGED